MTHGEQARPQEYRPRVPEHSTIIQRPLFDRDNGLREGEGVVGCEHPENGTLARHSTHDYRSDQPYNLPYFPDRR